MNMIIRFVWVFVFSVCIMNVNGQDLAIQLKEADNLEKQLKEPEALEKYKQILLTNPANIKSLVKATELNALLGGKEKVKKKCTISSHMLYKIYIVIY